MINTSKIEILIDKYIHLSISKLKKMDEKTENFIKKGRALYGDKYDYSKVVYTNARSKVIITCPNLHTYEQVADSHTRGFECQKCSSEERGKKSRDTTEEFIGKAAKVHGDKYDYSKVNYVTSTTKVTIICAKHGEFKQTPNDHLEGRGCSNCASLSIANKQRKTQEDFLKECTLVHGNLYDYSKIMYINCKIKVIIICTQHGDFLQNPNKHLNGQGCPKCAIIKTCNVTRTTIEEFTERSNKIHNNMYDYSEVDYKNTNTHVIIKCKSGHKFTQTPSKHLEGFGCNICPLCPNCKTFRTNGKLCDCCEFISSNNKHRKNKEIEVVKYLKHALPDNEFIHNKSVGKDCTEGHLYPDIRFDCIYYYLIVEVDEFQHRGSSYKCDEQRMYDIITKLGMPCIFIRFNPDGKDSNKAELLKMVNKYLNLDINNKQLWDDHGFKVEYMFYNNNKLIDTTSDDEIIIVEPKKAINKDNDTDLNIMKPKKNKKNKLLN